MKAAAILDLLALTNLYAFRVDDSNRTETAFRHLRAMVDAPEKVLVEVPERDSAEWDRAIGLMGLEAQVQLLPYALAFFGICLPIFIAVATYAHNAGWMFSSLALYAFNWAVFYAVLDWRKSHQPALANLRLHTVIHISAGLLWALALMQTSFFASNGGPFAEMLLVLCVGGAVGIIFFSSPSLPSLLLVGPTAVAGPIVALRADPATATTGIFALCASALALALSLILNKHLRDHFALALEREGLLVEREGALEETRRLAKSKSDILATLSHEIRNGLSGVAHVLSGALGNGGRGSASRDQLQAALAAARDLVEVLDATLDSETAEAGRLVTERQPLDAARLARDVVLLHRAAASTKGLQMVLQVDPALSGLAGSVVGDSARTRQILNNLVANAVKYTPRGRIELRAFMAAPDLLRIEVADTGPGLSAEELTRAFQPFERVARTGAGVSGAGLGLALSRRLAALMGGDLGADSAPGVGSRFWLDLPWDVDAPAPKVVGEAPTTPHRPLRILVVEDDQLNAAMLRAVLEQMGHKVLAAADGRRGLDLIRMGELDLALVDGRMPVMDGPEMIRALRALSTPAADMPVVAVTGGDVDEVRAMTDAGADAVLRKPVAVAAVARAVADALAERPSRSQRRAVA